MLPYGIRCNKSLFVGPQALKQMPSLSFLPRRLLPKFSLTERMPHGSSEGIEAMAVLPDRNPVRFAMAAADFTRPQAGEVPIEHSGAIPAMNCKFIYHSYRSLFSCINYA